MPRKKKPEDPHTHLHISVDRYEASVDASINHDAYDPQNAWDLNDNDPLYRFTSSLKVSGTTTYPDERAGEGYELTIYGDDAPSQRHNLTLKDIQARDKYNAPEYRTYRGKQIPVYHPPNGIGIIDKVRGKPVWSGFLFAQTRFVNEAVVILGQRKKLFMTVHEFKEGRKRWLRGISFQTDDPSEE